MKTSVAVFFLITGLLLPPAFAAEEKELSQKLAAVAGDMVEATRLAREPGVTDFDEKVLDLLYELCDADSLQLDRAKGTCD